MTDTDSPTTRVDAGHPDVPGDRYETFPSLSNPSMELYVELADGHTSMFEGAGTVHIVADNVVVQSYPFDNTLTNTELEFQHVTRQAKGVCWGYYRGWREANEMDPDATRRLQQITFVMHPSNVAADKLAVEFEVYDREDWAIGLIADKDDVESYIETQSIQVGAITQKQVRIDPDTPESATTATDGETGGPGAADFM